MPKKRLWTGRKKVKKHPTRWTFSERQANNGIFKSLAEGSLGDDKPLAFECGIIYNDGLLPERFTTLHLSVRCQSPSWCDNFLRNYGIYFMCFFIFVGCQTTFLFSNVFFIFFFFFLDLQKQWNMHKGNNNNNII